MKKTKEIKAVEMLSDYLMAPIDSGIDAEYNVYVGLRDIEGHHKGLLSSITGRGENYALACKDYCNKVFNYKHKIRRMNDGLFCGQQMKSLIMNCLEFDLDQIIVIAPLKYNRID